MLRIHFTYRHVDRPWGGANNFIRALRAALLADGNYHIVNDPTEPSDIVFMNQLGSGPAGSGDWRLADVRRWQAQGRRVVVRAVNLNRHAFPLGPRNLTLGWWRDRQTVGLLNLADFAIFQSEYQLQFFRRVGYQGSAFSVIHNGAAAEFWSPEPSAPQLDDTLRLVSSTASPRRTKRHDLITAVAACEGVEVRHMGAWPDDVPTGRVVRLGALDRQAVISELRGAHVLLHTAEKDPCPNAVFEAVCVGLPVIYNSGPGSSAEIVGNCGIPLDVSRPQFSVAAVRERLSDLRAAVSGDRQRFSIAYAAARYRSVFEEQASLMRAAG
jgi:glycosyltransferase involved in cell wall biosynthesis